jgi:hypothetical protein
MGVFDKYQTFIAGIIGFIGVIFTIYYNAKQARLQHTRELNHKKLAVRTALIEELTLILSSYQERIETLTLEKCKNSVLIPTNVPNQAYMQLISEIGILDLSEIKLVMTAYQLAIELPVRLNLMVTSSELEPEKMGYIKIDNSQILNIAQLHKNFVPSFESAINALKDNTQAL